MSSLPRTPHLRLRHHPGFSLSYCARYPAWVLFETEDTTFNMCFEIDLFPDGTVDASLQPGGKPELQPEIPDLYRMAAMTDRLHDWLWDCAMAFAWSQANADTLISNLTKQESRR